VPGTSWTLVMTTPSSTLFVAVNGSNRWLPWLILLGLSLLMGMAAWLAMRLLGSRQRLDDLNAKLADIARTDALTGLSNRLHLSEQLEGLLANGRRHGFAVSVMMIDVDHFKRLNDSYGHQAGDLALRHVAERLSSSLREGDLIARWGGEEFLAVLPYTDLQEAVAVAERLCRLVAAYPIEMVDRGDLVVVQTSVGVALAAEDSLDALVHRADMGLYEAKAAGRNTVRTYDASPDADGPGEVAQLAAAASASTNAVVTKAKWL